MAATLTSPLPKPGDIIDGKYTLEGLLGKGGMGAVFAARHNKLGHRLAIKVMLADAGNQEAAQRFINEGRAAANIQNDHVVRVFDVDEEKGYAFMVLELLEGEDLAQLLDRMERLPPHMAVAYVLQALEGVKQAHALGIVHRDLKPSNLFLATRQNGALVVKVLDFGISKANTMLGQAPGALTSTKAMLGSPLYMSPEQLRSSKNVDARADIWAFGIILFELMTGRLPFAGDNLGELFAAILETEPPPLRSVVPDAAPGLEAIVMRCLQRRPEHRFQTVVELQRELMPYAVEGAAGGATVVNPLPFGGTRAMPPQPQPLGQGTTGGGQHMQSTPNGLVGPPRNTPPPGMQQQQQAYGPPPHLQQQQQTPQQMPMRAGTVPLGAITPQPQGQTGNTANTWQNAGLPKPRSYVPLVAGLVLGLIGIGGLVLGLMTYGHGKTTTGGSPSASPSEIASMATTSTSAPSSSVATIESAAPTASVPPVVPSAVPSATTVAANTGAGGGGAHRLPPKVDPPKVDPPKVDPPKVDPPKTAVRPPPPPPPPPPTGGTLQGNR